MSSLFRIIFGIAAAWSAVYAISFSVNELKNKRPAGGLLSLGLVIFMIWAYIKCIGF
ncbi:MAG: hypothetical protein IKW64_00840 [Clostridia bacterium]|nr:hypothetical protein [Clostridia bacterium]